MSALTTLAGFFLLVPALALALPTICDAWMALVPRRRRAAARGDDGAETARLLFIVPAHNEESLIARCVASLRAQHDAATVLEVVVVADNCEDGTARIAAEQGATVLARTSDAERGKGHAIGWALQRVQTDQFSAIVIIDADTIVEPDFARHIAQWPNLRRSAVQAYDSLSNETENWLTRLAGLLTRNRYDIALPLKTRAGLSCPLTGDGVVIGTDVLRTHGWNPQTITEGWELYARYTLAGLTVGYEPRARLYAQETMSLRQSQTQRERWTTGRLSVFRMYWRAILTSRRLSVLQRLDLLAELTSLGPTVRAVLGASGLVLALLLARGAPGIAAVALFASCIVQPAVYSIISLARHPDPWTTAAAFLRLPVYAVWRAAVGVRAVLGLRSSKWVRTARHRETARRG